MPLARQRVVAHLRAAETSDPPLSDIALVVSEAVTNAVHHAYVDRPVGEVRVKLRMTADELVVTVEDDGRGLAPRPDTPGLGLGLPLMATLAKRLETHSAGVGTCVEASFSRDPAAATLPEQG